MEFVLKSGCKMNVSLQGLNDWRHPT